MVGRPKNNAKARVRIGEFYGHPWCGQFSIDAKTQLLDAGYHDHQCLPVLHNLLEDIHCHYNLTCTQLRNLLQSAEPKSAITDAPRKGTCATEEEKKVHKAYTECMSLQHQLNLVERCISRLTSNTECINDVGSLDNIKYDQLQVICNCLVDTLVALMGVGPSLDGYLAKPKLSIDWQSCLSQVTPVMCENLFRNLCVHGSPQKRERVGALLLNACGNRPWWGEFLSGVLKEFFSSNQKGIFPHERYAFNDESFIKKQHRCMNTNLKHFNIPATPLPSRKTDDLVSDMDFAPPFGRCTVVSWLYFYIYIFNAAV